MSVFPLKTVQATAHAGTVALLHALLERAESGEVIGVEIAYETADRYEYAGTVADKARAVGMLHLAIRSRTED